MPEARLAVLQHPHPEAPSARRGCRGRTIMEVARRRPPHQASVMGEFRRNSADCAGAPPWIPTKLLAAEIVSYKSGECRTAPHRRRDRDNSRTSTAQMYHVTRKSVKQEGQEIRRNLFLKRIL